MERRYLYLAAALIWGLPGVVVTAKGVTAYMEQPLSKVWWLLLITAGVMLMFGFMFRSIVDRYTRRIASLERTLTLWHTFPLRGWLLILFMMGLGVTLRFVPNIPSEFVASFYSGLGPMLILSGVRFGRNY